MKLIFTKNLRICIWPHFKSEVSSVEHRNDLLVYKANRCLNCDADEFLEWVKLLVYERIAAAAIINFMTEENWGE